MTDHDSPGGANPPVATRVLLDRRPFVDCWPLAADRPEGDLEARDIFARGLWPCAWIHHPQPIDPPVLLAFRLRLSLDQPRTVRLHATADEGYILRLDGQEIGRGPERGAISHWFFDTYDIRLEAGDHVLLAEVRALGPAAPRAQVSLRPGFLLAPDAPEMSALLGTGGAAWECKVLPGFAFAPPFDHDRFSIGYNCTFNAEQMDADDAGGRGWLPAERGRAGTDPELSNRQPVSHLLHPAMLPPMREERRRLGKVRSIAPLATGAQPALVPVVEGAGSPEAHRAWSALLHGGEPVLVPAGQALRVVVDLEDYYCARVRVLLGAGAGATISVKWAEALFTDASLRDKGPRDEIDGKFFHGVGDTFRAASSRDSDIGSILWRAGRYVEVLVTTEDAPLTIGALEFIETGYPAEPACDFEGEAAAFADWIPLALRSLSCSAHDSLIDGPYYEQMMWAGDGVQTALAAYCTQLDDRLVRKSLLLFDGSRSSDGLMRARWPARDDLFIVPYALHWINQLHDFAFWRDDPDFVKERLPGLRATCEAVLGFRDDGGLLVIRRGWNFVDWADGWADGIPPGADGGQSAILNWHAAYALTLAARLEETHGEPELATRARRVAGELSAALIGAFWNEEAGFFADDRTHRSFSEHAQCLATLSGLLPAEMAQRIDLAGGVPLTRCTISFQHFLLEALALQGRTGEIVRRLQSWSQYPALGLKTLPEGPEPTRSDCHAWGAHVLYHLQATILGIRPCAPGFRRVHIAPQPGPLSRIRGSIPHPRGRIGASMERSGDGWSATVHLPEGLAGTMSLCGESSEIRSGENRLFFPRADAAL